MKKTFKQINNNIINVKIVGSKRNNSRYLLDILLNNEPSKTAIVLLLNPSSTGREHIFFGVPWNMVNDVDATTKNVISILLRNNSLDQNCFTFDRLIVLNLFSYYSSKPRELGPIYFKRKPCCFHENIKTISKTIKNTKGEQIFIGWGNIDAIWQLKVVNKVLDILSKNNKSNVQMQTKHRKSFKSGEIVF